MHLVGFIIRIYHDARSPERETIKQYNSISGCERWSYCGYWALGGAGGVEYLHLRSLRYVLLIDGKFKTSSFLFPLYSHLCSK